MICPQLALVHIIKLKERRTEMLFQLHWNLVLAITIFAILGRFAFYQNLPYNESAVTI